MSRLIVVLIALTPLLAGCSNAPEQPSGGSGAAPDPQVEDSELQDREPEPQEEVRISPIPEAENTSVNLRDVLGNWAADAAACEDPAGAPVVITEARFESPEDGCDISEFVDSGSGFTATLTCERGRSTGAALLKLTPEDDALTLSWVGRDEPAVTLSRCE